MLYPRVYRYGGSGVSTRGLQLSIDGHQEFNLGHKRTPLSVNVVLTGVLGIPLGVLGVPPGVIVVPLGRNRESVAYSVLERLKRRNFHKFSRLN